MLTPLRMWAAASSLPRMRWRFRGQSTASSRTCVRGSDWGVKIVSMRATDHLYRIVLCRAPRGIDRRKQDNQHGAGKCHEILTQVLAHEQAVRLDQSFDLNRQPTQPLDGQLAN